VRAELGIGAGIRPFLLASTDAIRATARAENDPNSLVP